MKELSVNWSTTYSEIKVKERLDLVVGILDLQEQNIIW